MAHSDTGIVRAFCDIAWQGDGPVDNFVAISRALEAVAKGGDAGDYAEALDAFIMGENDLAVDDRQEAANQLWERGIR